MEIYLNLYHKPEEGIKMTDKTKIFDPTNSELSQDIQQLTPESSEKAVKAAFIRWNKELLVPMMEGIISDLQLAYAPYESMTVIRDMKTFNALTYIGGAIRTLQHNRLVYGHLIDAVSESMTRDQFLTLMGTLETGLDEGDWFPVSYGMGDAKMGHRYHHELWPTVTFRYYEARRISQGVFDTSYTDPLRTVHQNYQSKIAIENLQKIGKDESENAKILYAFFRDSLRHAVWAISEIDDEKTEHRSFIGQLFNISSVDEEAPSLQMQMEYFSRWGEKASAYMDRLSKATRQKPGYDTAKSDLEAKIQLLDSCLEKIIANRKE